MPDEISTPPDSGSRPQPGEADPAAATAPRRRRWLRLLLLTGGVFGLAIVAVGFYARSEDALQRIYVPMAERLMDAEIGARGLEHTFPLSVGLSRLTVFHRSSGGTLEIEDLETRWDLSSVLNEATPRLLLGRARAVRLVLPVDLEEEDEPDIRPTGIRQTAWIPVRIDKAEIESLDLRMTHKGQAWLMATLAAFSLSDLNPDQSARLSSNLDVEFAPRASGRVFEGEGEFEARLGQPEEGRALAWDIDWPVEVRERGEPPDTGDLEFSVIQRIEGSLSPALESEHTFQATATRRGEPAGAVWSQIRVGAPGETQRTLLLEARGDAIQPALINPVLAILGPESLSSGSVNGHLDLNIEGGRMQIDAELAGEDLRVAARQGRGESPPLSIDLAQEAVFHNEEQRLRVERTSLSVREGGAERIRARLTAPFEFQFQDDATTDSLSNTEAGIAPGEEPAGNTGAGVAAPARLEFTINRIEIDRLKPWTAIWGRDWLQPAAGGTLAAEVVAQVAPSARSVSLEGEMTVLDLLWDRGETGSTVGPLSFIAKTESSSPDLSRFMVPSFSAEIESSGRPLLNFDAGGSFNRGDQSLSGRISGSVPDLPFSLDQLGLLPEDAFAELEAGSLKLNVSAKRTSGNAETSIEGDAEIGKATLAVEGARLIRSAEADFHGHLPPEGARMEAIRLKASVTDEHEAPAGEVNMEGYWPTRFEVRKGAADRSDAAGSGATVSPAPGKLGIRARDFDLKPWLELFGFYLEDDDGPAWPTSADLTLTVDRFGEVFTLEGEERVGPITSATEDADEAAPASPQP